MPHWKYYAYSYKALSYLPLGVHLRRLYRLHVSRELSADAHLIFVGMEYANWYLRQHQRYGKSPERNPRILELPAGHFPTTAICLYLNGLDEIYTADRRRYVNLLRIRQMLKKFIRLFDSDKLRLYGTWFLEERMERLRDLYYDNKFSSPDDLLNAMNIRLCSGDPRKLDLPDHFFDIVGTNNYLEHFSRTDLARVLKELKRLGKPGGISSHLVYMGDRYRYLDNQIPPLNFLKFSRLEWWFYNNEILYQSRLRVTDYLAAFEHAGFGMLDLKRFHLQHKAMSALRRSRKFLKYDLLDAGTVRAWVTLRT